MCGHWRLRVAIVRRSRVIEEVVVFLMVRRVDLMGRVDLTRRIELGNRIRSVALLRLRGFERFDRVLEASCIKGSQSERICHTVTTSNARGLGLGLLGLLEMLPLLWVSGRITRPEAAFRRQCHGRRTWCVTLLVLRLRTTRMPYIFIIITVMPLLYFVGLPSLILDKIFTTIALGTGIVARIKPIRKEVRRRSRRRSGVELTLEVTHFLVVPVGMPPILASTGGPPVALLFLLSLLLISTVFFKFLLNRERLVRCSGLNRLARRWLCDEFSYRGGG